MFCTYQLTLIGRPLCSSIAAISNEPSSTSLNVEFVRLTIGTPMIPSPMNPSLCASPDATGVAARRRSFRWLRFVASTCLKVTGCNNVLCVLHDGRNDRAVIHKCADGIASVSGTPGLLWQIVLTVDNFNIFTLPYSS
jgi:hypothetical protein